MKNRVPYGRKQIAAFTREYRKARDLRAAAPLLLDALVKAKNYLIDLYERDYPNDEPENEFTEVIDCAISAISKARGEQ